MWALAFTWHYMVDFKLGKKVIDNLQFRLALRLFAESTSRIKV